MKRLAALAAIVALAACSGNFSTGTGMPQTQTGPGLPPMGQGTPLPETNPNGLPVGMPTPSASPGAAASATYPIADAKKGFACPDMGPGYGCKLSFNLPKPAPSPSPGASAKPSATPSPSPTPSPTPTPAASASPSSSPSASPKPTPAPPQITLEAQAPPQNAPKMVHVPANTLDTIALMMVQITTNADFPLDGWVSAQFTLPKAQVEGRGFAVQLFQVTKHKKNVDYKPIWTFDKSTLNDTTLTFSFKPPKMKIAKDSSYTLVLYGDDKSTAPSGSPSPGASASPASSPSPLVPGSPMPPQSPLPSATPGVTPSPR